MAINPENVDTVTVPQLDTVALALTNLFAHSAPNGTLGKATINSLATFVAPYIASVGASGYVEVVGSVLPDPVITNGYSLVGAGNYTQTGEANLLAAGIINLISWNGTTWSLTKEFTIDLSAIQETINPEVGYISCANPTVDWENPTVDSDWRSATTECIEGDVFDIKGFVFSQGIPLYAFLDANDAVIERFPNSGSEFSVTAVAPFGAVRIVHNSVASYENHLIKSGAMISRISTDSIAVQKENDKYTVGVETENAYLSASIGATVDPLTPTPDNGWAFATIECLEGDVFDIKGFSFSAGIPVYTFLNSSNVVIAISEPEEVNVLVNRLITAPTGAARVTLTSQNGYGAYLKKTVTAIGKLQLEINTSVPTGSLDDIVSTPGAQKLINKHSDDTSDWGWLNVTSAYIGYDVPAPSDALLKTARILRFNTDYATIDTLDAEILVGIIDQRRNFLPTRIYPVVGQRDGKLQGIYDAFEYIKFTLGSDAYIKSGEVCFIKVTSISSVIPQTIGINSVNYDPANKLLYARELTDSLTEVIGYGAMEFVIDTLPYTSIFSTKAELAEVDNTVKSLAVTVTNNTIFNDSATGENYKIKVFNGELILKSLNIESLLVIGNSMVAGSFTAQTGDDRAMAASVPNHGFADYLANKFGATLLKMNVFDFERNYATTTTPYDFAANWAVTDIYDAIVFSIGANTPSIDSTSLANLRTQYTAALNYLKSAAPSSEIYVHTPFQGDIISDSVQAAATAAYLPFIDTSTFFEFENGSDIFKVGDYIRDSVGVYKSIEDLGIARHPSDAGHRRIANTLLPAMASSLYTEDSFTINLIQASGGTISTPNKTWQKDGVVTIRITPDSGKTISSLTVKDSDNVTVTATQRTNTHGLYYTFILPAKDVTVTPTFV
jgi:hypothetical protein